ncbi:sulfatase family protein [Ulvibacterium marinum]|uniref:sulfatase family protein n=1 Tax=Ulvibacterium marinum TaxID=2419782 RepID=UPI00249581FF|nr:sulfatase-like hydrolase/transferase [Ulvibacterium marinum]
MAFKNYKILLKLILVLSLAISSCTAPPKRPNIILVMTDDLGWHDVGFNGNPKIKTPWLDSLASQGIILDRFYSASAVCSPTRASVLTGRNPLRMHIPTANSGHLKDGEITLPELLKKAGYTTGHFGKWHLGTLTRSVLDANRGGQEKFRSDYSIPSQHGYDTYFCTESKVPTFDPMVYPLTYEAGESKRYGWKAVKHPDSTQAYGTAYWTGENQRETRNLKGDDSSIIVDCVLPFIENAQEENKPFFTTLWFHTPHLPVVSDSVHRAYYPHSNLAEQLYYGTLTALDEQMGRLWQMLEATGVEQETILFFCSDNGPERRTPGSAGIFRERKRSLHEGGVRVPAFVIWKNGLEGGERMDFPMVTSDYLPTILDILDIPFPDDRALDGISVLKVLEGKADKRSNPIGFIYGSQISWVTDQYKLIGDESLENLELYDLIRDPSEKENVIQEYPKIAEQLKADLSAWLNSVENSKQGMDYH